MFIDFYGDKPGAWKEEDTADPNPCHKNRAVPLQQGGQAVLGIHDGIQAAKDHPHYNQPYYRGFLGAELQGERKGDANGNKGQQGHGGHYRQGQTRVYI